MSQSDYVGIDYSLGRSNYNQDTGIHYGVISQHAINQDILSEFENEYPECENPECEDYCECAFESIGMTFEDSEYLVTDCLDSDLMILKSPYYTYCQYCSPCVPGAGNIGTEVENGVKTYCLGLDWYDNYTPMPHKHLWRVDNNEQIQ
jgi:hypothetical protein